MSHRILVPLDGSAGSEVALHEVRRFFWHEPCRITLAHVLEDRLGRSADETSRKLERRAEDYLGLLKRQVEDCGTVVDIAVRKGKTGPALARLTKDRRASLVALPVREVKKRFPFGRSNVPATMLRSSPVPVLFVKAKGKVSASEAAESPPGRVLLVLDGSEASLDAVPTVLSIARRWRARIFILYVLPTGADHRLRVRRGEEFMKAADQIHDPGHIQVGRHLNDACWTFRREGLEVVEDVEEGPPEGRISEVCEAWKVDLVALSPHRQSGRTRYINRKLCEKLIGAVEVPVLVVPGHARWRKEKKEATR